MWHFHCTHHITSHHAPHIITSHIETVYRKGLPRPCTFYIDLSVVFVLIIFRSSWHCGRITVCLQVDFVWQSMRPLALGSRVMPQLRQTFCRSWPVHNMFVICNLFLQLIPVWMQVPFSLLTHNTLSRLITTTSHFLSSWLAWIAQNKWYAYCPSLLCAESQQQIIPHPHLLSFALS